MNLISAGSVSADSISADSAVPADVWCHIEQFKAALQLEKMKMCSCYNECWFQMKLRNYMCTDYIKNKQNSLLFSNVNCLNSDSVSANLSELSEIEKMLIAHVHVHQQIACVYDHQYWYTDHIICFAQNISKIWYQLSLLSWELDIIVLKSAATELDHHLHRWFRQRFTVHCSAIDIWLRYLKINHSVYADIELNEAQLQSLSDNDSILNLLSMIMNTFSFSFLTLTVSLTSQTLAEDDIEFKDDIFDMIVSDLIITVTESELLWYEIKEQYNFDFELLIMNTVLVNERANFLILSSVFLTLFFMSKADFILSWIYLIKLSDYAKHFFKYKNN